MRARPQLRYLIGYEQTPNNRLAYVPDLPGGIATGETRGDVARLIREGIAIFLDELKLQGLPAPTPITSAELFEG